VTKTLPTTDLQISTLIDEFLDETVKKTARGNLVFSLDATASREPTWDMATHLQSQMFNEVTAIGSLDIQVVYFRGRRSRSIGRDGLSRAGSDHRRCLSALRPRQRQATGKVAQGSCRVCNRWCGSTRAAGLGGRKASARSDQITQHQTRRGSRTTCRCLKRRADKEGER
jgi:hypothetical protein